MNKSNTLFEIDKYDLQEDKILVNIFRKGKEETVVIPRQEFEQWLADSGRLEWVSDGVTYNGEHEQSTWTTDIENYWDDVFIDKNPDLYDWIVINWIAEGVFDIKQPLETILGEYYRNSISSLEKIAL